MKKTIIILFIMIASVYSCFSTGKEEPLPGNRMTAKIITFEKKSVNTEIYLSRLQTSLNRIKAGYNVGYSFEYSADGAVRTSVDAEVRGGSLDNMIQDETVVNNEEYIYASGDFTFLSPEYPENSRISKTVSISSEDQIQQLYGRLLSQAVRENCAPGSKGMIYPAGDMSWSISGKKVTLKSKFIIMEK